MPRLGTMELHDFDSLDGKTKVSRAVFMPSELGWKLQAAQAEYYELALKMRGRRDCYGGVTYDDDGIDRLATMLLLTDIRNILLNR